MLTHSGRYLTRVMERIGGLSYYQIFLLWVANILIFALIYTILSYVSYENLKGIAGAFDGRFLTAVYFSVTVATATGFGDILPIGISRLFVAIEAITGLFLFGVFIAKMMSHRQELALRDVHRISFENTFHNIREDLHVVRTDFDHIMRTARETHALTTSEWDELAVAYEQITNLVEEIPDFYDSSTNRLYAIDVRREGLLLEAVHRTLGRVNQLLEVLSEEHVRWAEHETSVAKLRELVGVTGTLFGEWRHRSPYHKAIEFEKLTTIIESLRARLAAELPVES
jgi:hypothetical protein